MAINKVSTFIANRILEIGKSQTEIANEVGYDKPNMISMIKIGATRVPLEKIPALAKALEVDAALLFRLALEQYWPGLDHTIFEIFGTVLTKNEREIIEAIRSCSDGADPELTPDRNLMVKAMFDASETKSKCSSEVAQALQGG